jgi:predicted Zn-dependent protease
MSIKALLLIIVIAAASVFIYLKIMSLGDPNSNFNQTTRYSLGKKPWVRTVLSLHNDGDARGEYFCTNCGPLVIEWFKPQTEEVNKNILEQFAKSVTEYTGRQAQAIEGGPVGDSILSKSNLSSLTVKKFAQKIPNASILYIFFVEDYKPRDAQELSTTYGESAMLVSLNAHRAFLKNYPSQLDIYLFSTLLHEFGHEIGLQHNNDSSCVMYAHAGIGGQPMEVYSHETPTDFCPAEQNQINQLRVQYNH